MLFRSELVADYDRIRERIARVIPGFEDFNARVRHPGGFHLEHPCRARQFPTPSGRAQLLPHTLDHVAPIEHTALFQLMTVRSHDQYNTTIDGLDYRYRGARASAALSCYRRLGTDGRAALLPPRDGLHVP